MPDYGSPFVRALYATYLSYLDTADFAYGLQIRTDARGSLAELFKQPAFGQIFVSRTKPGITRGNHFHHTKTEKFAVVEGEAVVRFRHILGDEVFEFRVKGEEFRIVDIPPGYTHSIENTGSSVLVTLFWASEVFDPQRPDTFALPVAR
jgi:UDP-2-acetamido-2,6-beta-L-arabino-hexul-4-ose reductase